MKYTDPVRMPTPMKITARSSSITNAFVNSIIPAFKPTDEEKRQSLKILGMGPGSDPIPCAYCGDPATEWDHLRPLVMKKQPTGYISEIRNLVPACGKCNQSKGNKEWKVWIQSNARLSPKTRGIPGLGDRIKRLEEYEQWGKPSKLDFAVIVGEENWKKHWQNQQEIFNLMKEAQKHAEKIKMSIAQENKRP